MLEALKKEVCEIAKRAQRDGLCKHKSGNFSAKDFETGYVVITPTGIDREVLNQRDMIVIDLNANVIENLSNLKPTSETLMHLMIYKQRPKVNAIAHTHSMYATTFALLKKEIPAIVYEVISLGLSKARVPVAPYGRPGTPELADSIIESCMEADVFLLEKHGVVAIDERNMYEAYLKAAYVEELAELYYHALAVNKGKEPDYFEMEELQKWQYPSQINFL
ncbi:MAG: class II aldolase/adducin family protein [Oscillospiraceae bacterium]|nr:class II aldolase/adducin family protein [Oscillospiraceae bacterium]